MAKKTMRKGFSILLSVVMLLSVMQVSAFAAQLVCDETEHTHGDDCYTIETHTHSEENGCYEPHEHNRRRCEGSLHTCSTDTCNYETHTHSDDCYREHRHTFFCLFECGYEEGEMVLSCDYEEGEAIYTCDLEGEYEFTCTETLDLTCNKREGDSRVLSCELKEHTHRQSCYKEDDYALHLDIHIGLTAKYILDGRTYDADVQLTKEDYTNGNLEISATAPFSITGTEIHDVGQRRFNGTFPVGTYEDPVYYTISLTKNVVFNVEGERVSIPMTFERTVHFWDEDNICETITGSSSRLRDWQRGEFVYGGMDFKLGASEVTETSPAVDATLTIQKNVSGITLDADKEYSFAVYQEDGSLVETVSVTVSAGSATAIGTVALP